MNTTRKTAVFLAVVILVAIALAITPALAKGPGGVWPPPNKGGGEEEAQGNNLSFPAIAVDGFEITPIESPSFTVPYAGDYGGLTQSDIDWLLLNGGVDGDVDPENGHWYAQKTEGNVWQADFNIVDLGETCDVGIVNWGDNIESVDPKVRRPFRLEVSLFVTLETPLYGYTMAELEYPSSSNELQGTNTVAKAWNYATVVSDKPGLVVQYLGATLPTIPDEDWNGEEWDGYDTVEVSFAPELNVGGKYIFGASEGGWTPKELGYYRITFYVPDDSGISLASAEVANDPTKPAEDGETVLAEAEEGGGAVPVVKGEMNLTYADVLVVAGGGGPKRPE